MPYYRRYHRPRRGGGYTPPAAPAQQYRMEKMIEQEVAETLEVEWRQESCNSKPRFKKYTEHKNNFQDSVMMFYSGADLVECFNKNLKFVGGTGEWTDDSLVTDGSKSEWTFGHDLPNHASTALCVEEGRFPQKYLDMYEKGKADLFTRFPQLHELVETAMSKKRRRRFREDGDELDIDRYMCNDTAMWQTVIRSDVRIKSASLYMEIGVSCGTDTKTITKNVIFLTVLADILEMAGITTDIYFGATGQGGMGWRGGGSSDAFNQVLVKAKNAGEPLDIARLLSFAAPGFYRQFVFAAWANGDERWPYVSRRCVDGFNLTGSHQCGRVLTLINPAIKIHGATHHVTDGQIELMINAIKDILNIPHD